MIIGISGLAGSGKDTAADFLVRDHDFTKVAFADPMKRICRDVYKFSFDQLWGPSAMRNAPDKRYPRSHRPFRNSACACCGVGVSRLEAEEGAQGRTLCYLTPRFALQQLGSEWARVCYPNTWVEYALDVADKLDREGGYNYDRIHGLRHDWRPGEENWHSSVVIPDVRFKNEIEGLRLMSAKIIRIVRPGAGLTGAAGQHRSETEQNNIPDDVFDAVVDNSGTLEDLRQIISNFLA